MTTGHAAIGGERVGDTPARLGTSWWGLTRFTGPGVVVAIGYMDPGNWATDLAAGTHHGFNLLAVVLFASAVGAFLQALTVRLSLARGKDLATLIRDTFPRPIALFLWLAAEVAIILTDLCELVGGALAFHLLFGLPLIPGAILTGVIGLLILLLPSRQGRTHEVVLGAMAIIVGVCFAVKLAIAQPDLAAVLMGYVPKAQVITDPAQLYLALGIIGATIMPHNIYLHSGLAQSRFSAFLAVGPRIANRALVMDSTVALSLAFLVNSAILILAATLFRGSGTDSIEGAYWLLNPAASSGTPLIAILFAIALLAAGQSSTITGAMAGQIVTEGFLRIRMALWLRRFITRSIALVPAVAAFLIMGDQAIDDMMVLSQVGLSLALPFVLFPMLILISHRANMGALALKPRTLALAWLLASAITLL
ncbi:MAG: Nramp family divalent metal transporter, partial [Pseudomonadota bacterium]|nr:Nramp family divalent metal transporter [Pseudomonadota bacterium]